MKKEAMEKLDNLEKASFTTAPTRISETKLENSSNSGAAEMRSTTTLTSESKDKYVEKLAVSNIPRASTVKYRDELSLLEDTTWKISLSIGRERGMY